MYKKIRILAHRGYRSKYPENTLLAFKKGFDAGADGLECDIQKTKDGNYVIIHDDSVDRTAQNGIHGKIAEMTLEEIRRVDLGEKQHILELREFLEVIPSDKYVNIELKEETLRPEDSESIAHILLSHFKLENLMISSFEHSLLPLFKEKGFTIGLLIGRRHLSLGTNGLVKHIRMMKPDYINLPIKMFEESGRLMAQILIFFIKRISCGISFWTVNTAEELALAIRYGDIVMTDDVELIKKELSRLQAGIAR